jgi:TP901 family phage tail tape measure protein
LSEQNIVTNITATANFNSLTAQLQSVTSQLLKLQATTIGLNKNLTSQVGVMNRQFDETMRSTGQFARHFVTLTSDVTKFGQNLDSGRMKLGDYFRTWQDHTKKTGSLVKELAKQQVALENAIVQPLGKNAQGLMQYNVMVQSGLDGTKNKSALLRQELSIMNKVMSDGAGQLINWGKNTQWAGRQLTVGLTVPIAAFGMAAAKAFQQADQELTRLTKVYGGLTATSTADLLQVRKDVSALSRELASGLGANVNDTIALAADIAATGKQGNDLLNSTRETTRLAVLGEVDRQEAMKATLSIQTAFGQNTQQLAQSIDFLNAVENQTSTSLQDLVEAIPKAGPVVKALGGDVKDLALYLTAMREGGINASEGANALKSALASIINPTKVAKDMFSGLGIDLGGIVTKNAGNLTGTIMALKDSLDTLDPLNRAKAIEQLFGKFQFARMNALFENLGKQGSQTLQVLDLMKASTTDLANISARELKTMTESASGKYKRALESVKADLVTIGEQFLKVGTFVLNAIDGIVKFIGHLPAPIKAVLGFIGGLTAIAGPIIMLTGVLANFFGYIIKGIFALKNIGKGGTGFKLLTPELMAASAAANTVEESFYNDTKAAATFSDAVLTLAASFEKLKQNAMSSTVATANSMSTVAGNTVLPGGGRIVDKNNPLVGQPYSRDMSHLIPTGSKTAEQRANETIFSTVPGPKPVNQRISNAPQVYMNNDMPKIPGITSVNGVSTGIVASEAAKWHSMTAAIAMQSKAELATLKTEVAATGTITASLADSYQALLPKMTQITSLAADEAALIVKELEVGKLTVDGARAKIFTLNAKIESMMAQTASAVAATQARSVNLTTVPLTTQPVVSATGKSNMKELFHKTETSKLVDTIARQLGVRTSGAGYSMHTTIPRKYNTGGKVESFGANKTQVSGPASISYDDRLGTVPVGGYVLNQAASLDPRNAALVAAAPSTYKNSGGEITAMLTPKETVFGPGIQDNPALFDAVHAANNGTPLPHHAAGGSIKLSRSSYGGRPSAQQILQMFSGSWSKAASRRTALIRGNRLPRHYYSTATGADANARRMDLITSHNSGWKINKPDGSKYTLKELEALPAADVNAIWKGVDRSHFAPAIARNENGQYVSPGLLGPQPRYGAGGNLSLNSGGDPRTILKSLNGSPIHPFSTMKSAAGLLGYPKADVDRIFNDAWSQVQQGLRNRTKPFGVKTDTFEEFVGKILSTNLRKLKVPNTAANFYDEMSQVGTLRGSGIRGSGSSVIATDSGISFFNMGGAIGGLINRSKKNYGQLPSWIIRNEKIKNLGNTDPAHGVLQIGKFQPAMHVRNQYVAPKIRYRGSYYPYSNDRGPNAGKISYIPKREGAITAFETGTLETRAKTALYNYMQGDYSAINDPAVQTYLSTLRTKFSGTLHRGVRNINSLPASISTLIQQGKWEDLVGKEFIMRRSSWSKNPDTAEGFGQLQMVASVKNRNAVPASEIFPDLTFHSAQGPVPVNESEVYMGGKFRIVAASKNKLKLQAVVDAAREHGGPVNAGRPYLVGEKGPELFVPKNSGGIIPSYEIGGLISRAKRAYGVSGNPAKAAAAAAAKAARAAAFTPADITQPQYVDGPLSVGRSTIVGNGGVRTNVYSAQGSLPYAPGLTIGHATLNKTEALLKSAGQQIGMSIYALGTSIKDDADKVKSELLKSKEALKYSGQQMVTGSKMVAQDIKSGVNYLGTESKKVGTVLMNTGKIAAGKVKDFGSYIKGWGASPAAVKPGAFGEATLAQNFGANARYTTSNMLHPVQYLRNRNILPAITRQDENGFTFGKGAVGSTIGTVGGMAVGTALGAKLGGQNGAMMGSIAGSMAGPQVAASLGKAIATRAAASAAASGMATAGFGATAAAAAGLVAPLAAVTLAGIAGYKMWKHYKEGQTLNISTFGMTAEAAKKAGVRFTDFGSKMKDAIQDARDLQAANKLTYESMKDGGTPFKMTIAEYKKLKVEVKETFGEQIKALNRQPSTKVPDAVRRIKEQLIAAGMSADEATKKVYTMLRLSNKKDQSITATMGNSKFKAITDSQTAAVSAVSSFGQSTKNEGSKERAASLNTALMATETGINDLIAKRERLVAKDTTGKVKSLSYTEAEKMMLDRLNNSKEAGTKITQETVDELAKTNPQVKKIINGTDTLISVWQKIRLEALGYKGDLSKLDAETTKTVAAIFSSVSASVQATNRTGMLKEQYANLDKLKGQIASYTKAIKGQTVAQQISDRDRLAALNKQIEANNKLAEARKKALAASQADADLGRQIEKTRLEMQNASATGDTAKAQSLRIDLESLTSQQQTDAQMRAIDKANEAANAPLKAAVEAMSNKQQKLSDSAALASESLDKIKAKYDTQQAAIDKVNNSMTALYANAKIAGVSVEEYATKNKEAAAGLVAAYEAATGKKMDRYTTDKNGKKVPISPQQNAIKILSDSKAGTGVDEAAANSIKGGATLQDIVNAVNKQNGKPTSTSNSTVFGKDVLTGKGKDVYSAYKNVLSQGQSKKIITETGFNGELFQWNNKTYASDTATGLIYSYDQATGKVGTKAIKKAATGVMGGKGMFLVGEKGPELIHLKDRANIMPNDVMNTLAAASPRYNFNKAQYSLKDGGVSGSSYVVNQTIYASEGMDVEALSNMIVKKAEVVIGQKAKVNVKMVGQGKSI